VSHVDEEEVQAITETDLAALHGTEEFDRVVKSCKIFAKLTPSQKGQVIMNLRGAGEVVGMLGDGINDCVALRYADAGISVDTGTNVAKECADGKLSFSDDILIRPYDFANLPGQSSSQKNNLISL